MQQTAIFAPWLAMFALTFVVWVYMYVRRIRFIREMRISPAELAVPGVLAERSPPEVSNPSDNLKNLFEVPLLFYVLVLYLFATGQVDPLYVGAAWCFFAFRALHSLVHCTINLVMLRFNLYLLSSLALWFMAGRAAIGHLGA